VLPIFTSEDNAVRFQAAEGILETHKSVPIEDRKYVGALVRVVRNYKVNVVGFDIKLPGGGGTFLSSREVSKQFLGER
jgi:hypothetical protein